jgi:hypothetical protein
MADKPDAPPRQAGPSRQAGPARPGAAARPGQPRDSAGPEDEYDDRPGDPVCWLCRVCPACGTLADADPPTICPQCRALIPRV